MQEGLISWFSTPGEIPMSDLRDRHRCLPLATNTTLYPAKAAPDDDPNSQSLPH